MTVQDISRTKRFADALKIELEKYTSITCVNEYNIIQYMVNLNSDSLIVLFNDRSSIEESVYHFLKKAKEKGSLIYPVAMQKDVRMPVEIISEKNSYDVEEELRCRNLNDGYLESIARGFARKIISRVMPTLYNENGLIFVSHRRLDGEEIAADLCDQLKIQFNSSEIFRDIKEVEVGEEAQTVIDSAMQRSDAFIFLHTQCSGESKWIQKELRFSLLRNIPILWIQIDDANISTLKIRPTEKPHLKYNSKDFQDKDTLIKIAEEIVQKVFELIMYRNNKVFDYLDTMQQLFGDMMCEKEKTELVYTISVPRKGYSYPQRNIKQHFQLFGITPVEKNIKNFEKLIGEDKTLYDSAIILTDRIVKRKNDGNDIIQEPFEDFCDCWKKYLDDWKEDKKMEIVISGAFPEGDEICKQSLTDALVVFSKSIIKDGYTLTFGSHPTFQELFFEIAKEACPMYYKEKLKMYISEWFENLYVEQKKYYMSNAQLIETERGMSRTESLSKMRKKMIQRNEVRALICLGGKIREDKKEEGIREEIQLAQEFGIPVFVVGSVGGCSSEIALECKNNQWERMNKAPIELNLKFMESLDYFTLSQLLLQYLDNKETE